MAIAVKYDVSGMTTAKYDQIIAELEQIGQGAPAGRKYHVAYGDENNLQAIDVFERPDQLEAFGAKLMPILQKHGVRAKPEVLAAHNVIVGR